MLYTVVVLTVKPLVQSKIAAAPSSDCCQNCNGVSPLGTSSLMSEESRADLGWFGRGLSLSTTMEGDAIGCQGQRLQNFTEARLNIPELFNFCAFIRLLLLGYLVFRRDTDWSTNTKKKRKKVKQCKKIRRKKRDLTGTSSHQAQNSGIWRRYNMRYNSSCVDLTGGLWSCESCSLAKLRAKWNFITLYLGYLTLPLL